LASRKLLGGGLAFLSVALAATIVLGFFAYTNGVRTHAAAPTILNGKARFHNFKNHFSDADLASTPLKHWNGQFTYQGTTYKYTMVGTNPSSGSVTTTVPVTIIPLKLTFSDSTVLDGSQKVSNTTASPIFQNAQFSSGNTQYGDAIQRAEFWKKVTAKSTDYHVVLGQPTIAATVSLTVPAANGQTKQSAKGKIGLIDINWFDAQAQQLIQGGAFTPNMVPLFLSNNVFLYDGGDPNNCCIIGYHNVLKRSTGLQTYIWSSNNDSGTLSDPTIADVDALSHEVAEWYNDPYTNNQVPSWSVPSAPQYGCSNVLETGDPLVGTSFGVNGYHLQDEAFFSWFARKSPSIGINGRYTYLGTFTTFSPAC